MTGQGESSGVQEKAQEVAGQAQEKAQEAAGQAQGMLREQVNERSTQAGEQISGTAEDLRSVSEELRKKGKDTPAKFADQAAERTEQLGSYLSEADAEQLLSDLEDFGRRRPWAVLAGGVVVGVAAARFLKASSQSRYQERVRSQEVTREVPAAISPERGRAVPAGAGGVADAPSPVPSPADPVMG